MREVDKASFIYKSPTDQEMKKLVRDVIENKVFISTDPKVVEISFMVIKFVSQDIMEEMEKAEIVALYEYYDKALKMAINGHHIFMSFKCLSRDDYVRFCSMYKKAKSVWDSIFKESEED